MVETASVRCRTKRKGLGKSWERCDIARQMLPGRWPGSPVQNPGGFDRVAFKFTRLPTS